MNSLVEWISTIIVFIFLVTIVGMLLPNSNMKNYVKMVAGLLLIVIILNPVFKLLQTDLSDVLSVFDSETYIATGSLENAISEKKKEIQQNERAYILEQAAVQMAGDVEEDLEAAYSLKIADITVYADEEKEEITQEDISGVQVIVQAKKEEGAISAIKDIEIDTENTGDEEGEKRLEELRSFFAEKWELSKEQIVVSEEGGE